ncbi:MAG: type II toxin-antitoxin system Phd/YefM family antitoxin [Deltaproteobacteria bacterium]|nr:type II toxin-antitoxin system Phd/YefM family antitoxin [Deltaproteobacteria bacterium]
MTRMAAKDAREKFGDTLNRVTENGDKIVLQRRGKDVAVLLPIAEWHKLQEELDSLQDRLDAAEATRRFADPKEKPIPYEKARKSMGLR